MISGGVGIGFTESPLLFNFATPPALLLLMTLLLICTTGDSRLLRTLTPLFTPAPLPVRVSMTTIGGGTDERPSSEEEFVNVVDAME